MSIRHFLRTVPDRVHAFLHPYPLTERHAYAIGQTYGVVQSDDAAGIARLERACERLKKRYRACSFHVEAHYPDTSKTSIYGDTGYISDEAEGVLLDLATGTATVLSGPEPDYRKLTIPNADGTRRYVWEPGMTEEAARAEYARWEAGQ